MTLRMNGQDPISVVAPTVGTYYLDPYYNLKEEIWMTDPGSSLLNLNMVFSRQNNAAQAWLDRILVQGRPRIQPDIWPSYQVFYNASTLGVQPTQYRWPAVSQPHQIWDITLPWAATAYPLEDLQINGANYQQILVHGDRLRHLCFIKGNSFAPPCP